MRKSKAPFALDARCVGETPDALLVIVDELELWIPKSQVLDGSEVAARGDEGELVIPEWLAVERGLA